MKKNINTKRLNVKSKHYPECLKGLGIDITLNYTGEFQKMDTKAVGIVGTRECTRYGRKVVRSLIRFLTQNNMTIVSGMGYGTDECVHRNVLSCGGRSMGFLGFSFDLLLRNEVVPSVALINKMMSSESHIVVSPFKENTSPSKDSYILRNNVMAAFCSVLIVVEAGGYSNTLSIVEAALEYGKPIFAVPGSIFSEKSVGTHKMIQEGANVLRNYSDILNSIN